MNSMSANQLRWLAEAADGLRGEEAYLVEQQDGTLAVKRALAVSPTDKRLMQLDTAWRGAGMRGDAQVRILWNGRIYDPTPRDMPSPDALFVTQSAVEKFLLPYYMRFLSAAQVQALENKLYNSPGVAAAFHIHPSFGYRFPEIGIVTPHPSDDKSDVMMFDINEELPTSQPSR